MNAVRIGILSTAHVHTAAYAAIADGLADVEFVGVTDDDTDRGRTFAEEHGTELVATDELLDSVDAVFVCSENTAHSQWVERAAATDTDVLCEKPIATTVEAGVGIRDVCLDSNIDIGVAMPLRFSEPAIRAKRQFEDGRIGSLQLLAGMNRGQRPGSWFADPAKSGGGAAMDHTVHIVDLVHWLTEERVAEVYAQHDTRFEPLSVEDVNVLSMELTDGTAFTLDGSWSRPDEWDFWGDATLELVGTKGSIDVDCFDQTFKLTRDDGPQSGIASVYWGSDPNVGLIRDFVNAVRTDRRPEITPDDAVDAVAVVEAAYESAESGDPVSVSYPTLS
jgi:predicted dehydrogenase